MFLSPPPLGARQNEAGADAPGPAPTAANPPPDAVSLRRPRAEQLLGQRRVVGGGGVVGADGGRGEGRTCRGHGGGRANEPVPHEGRFARLATREDVAECVDGYSR